MSATQRALDPVSVHEDDANTTSQGGYTQCLHQLTLESRVRELSLTERAVAMAQVYKYVGPTVMCSASLFRAFTCPIQDCLESQYRGQIGLSLNGHIFFI